MDGVPVTLEASEEAEGEEADEEADQRQQDADPRDDIQEHVVDGILVLEERRGSRHTQAKRGARRKGGGSFII